MSLPYGNCLARYAGVILLLFLIANLYLIGVCLVVDERIKALKTHVQMRVDYVVKCTSYSTLNSERNWEDLCIQFRNQQKCSSDNHN